MNNLSNNSILSVCNWSNSFILNLSYSHCPVSFTPISANFEIFQVYVSAKCLLHLKCFFFNLSLALLKILYITFILLDFIWCSDTVIRFHFLVLPKYRNMVFFKSFKMWHLVSDISHAYNASAISLKLAINLNAISR